MANMKKMPFSGRENFVPIGLLLEVMELLEKELILDLNLKYHQRLHEVKMCHYFNFNLPNLYNAQEKFMKWEKFVDWWKKNFISIQFSFSIQIRMEE